MSDLNLALPSPRLPQRWHGAGWSGLVTLAVHVSAAMAVTFVAIATPVTSSREVARATSERIEIPRMVFLQMPGPGGGGGGGGNRQQKPPSRAQAIGTDRITLPVARPVVAGTRPADKPSELPVLLPSAPLASGTAFQMGMPEAPSSLPFSLGPGSGGGVGEGTGTGIGSGRGAGYGPGSGGGFGGGAYRPGNGVSAPTILSQVRPNYTSDAMLRRTQGTVVLEVVVGRDGIPSAIRVVKSLDEHGLDDEAIRAVQLWRFVPGRIGDTPVDVLVKVVLEFRIT
jgi:TonB family protein